MYKMDFENSDGYCGLEYKSPKELESEISSDEDFYKFFYSLYRCLPNERNDFNNRRNQIRIKYPELVIPVGNNFILIGEAAYEILTAHFYSLSLIVECEEDVKKYYFKRYEQVKEIHKQSQSLPVKIDLTEGQMGTDKDFEFYIKQAVLNKLLTVWKT